MIQTLFNEYKANEANQIISQNNNTGIVSAADEILKFKNLMDSGIISQAEFEAKKQQLLGLQDE